MKNNLLVVMFVGLCLSFVQGYGQIDIRGKVKQKTIERVDRKLDEGIDKALDQVEQSPEATSEEENDENETARQAKLSGEPVAEAQQKTPLSTYSRYDFIPGERVIFYDDFSQEKVGDFPAHWNTNKGGEVMTTNNYPGHWFMMKEDGLFYLDEGFLFPENFTLEFDVIPVRISEEAQSAGFDLTLLASEEGDLYPSMFVPGRSGIALNLYDQGGSLSYATYNEASYLQNGEYDKPAGLLKTNESNHVSIWVQKTRFRLYLHGEKIFDLPRALQAGHQYDQIRFITTEESYHLITNFRVADAAPDSRSKLITEGKLVTRGITFDTGSDVIKAISYGVLKEISQVLKENPSVKVLIVGHTDSDGNDAANLTLSRKRADAVKNALVKEFGIEAERMETDGKGESEPISPNTTAEGKANNRRVEFIKS